MGVSILPSPAIDYTADSFSRYEMMDGINTADCNLEPMVPCSSSSGWPTRQVYVQACMSQEPPVGWLKFPVECGGQGPIPEDGSLGSTFLIDQSGYL